MRHVEAKREAKAAKLMLMECFKIPEHIAEELAANLEKATNDKLDREREFRAWLLKTYGGAK